MNESIDRGEVRNEFTYLTRKCIINGPATKIWTILDYWSRN
jgi:hypothetical protein